MDEESKKQLLQKKIFDNPELFVSTHVIIFLVRLSVRFVIPILRLRGLILIPACILMRRRVLLKYLIGLTER
jgi:hypothetical protein